MSDYGVFSLLEIRKRKSRSHGIRKTGNGKRKKRAVKISNTSLKDLSKVLEDHGRHSMLSYLSSLPISVLLILFTKCFDVLLENVHQSGLIKGACFISYRISHGFIQEKNHVII